MQYKKYFLLYKYCICTAGAYRPHIYIKHPAHPIYPPNTTKFLHLQQGQPLQPFCKFLTGCRLSYVIQNNPSD